MNFNGELARRISKRHVRFMPSWTELGEERKEIALKVLVMCEMIGGREKTAEILDVSDNTIDNYRHGSRQPKHITLVKLTEYAELPPSVLNYRWSVEGDELLFEDVQGNVLSDPAETFAQAVRFDDAPSPYTPGFDEPRSPRGFDEPDNSLNAAFHPWFRSHLQLDPKNVAVLFASDAAMAPAIADGAPVFVDMTDRSLSDGGVYALKAEKDFMFRRIRRLSNGGVDLISSNDTLYPPKRVNKSKVPGLQVAGRVRFPPV